MSRIHPLVWFLAGSLILVVGGVYFFSKNQNIGQKQDSDKPDAVSKQVEGTVEYTIVGRNHIAQGTTGAGYNSNPPTSGPHWPSPAKNGIYESTLVDEQLIHNLEHGYIWISYRPQKPSPESTGTAQVAGLSEDEINKLKDIVKGDNWKIVLEPRDKNEKKIALAAWGRLLSMDEPDYDKIRDFIKTYRNRAPEKTPD